MSSYQSLDAGLAAFGDSIDRSRQALYYCDVDFLRRDRKILRQDFQASTYVLIGAAIESFTRTVVQGVADEVSAQNLQACDLSMNLIAVSAGSPFLALQDVRGLKMWKKRIELLSHATKQDVATLSPYYLPLDGRTIRPEHLEVIWMVFGFAGPTLPDLTTGLALKMVADYRNLVAHGEESTSVVAGLQTINDTLKLLARIVHGWWGLSACRCTEVPVR